MSTLPADIVPVAVPALSARSKYGWAAGDFGFNIFWQALNLLMMPFYTDVLGLDSALAGTVFLLATAHGAGGGAIGPISFLRRQCWSWPSR
jgi:glycoside/pentoside/hexuronide:cation symporter, GPH family